jgi:hypothetical protein
MDRSSQLQMALRVLLITIVAVGGLAVAAALDATAKPAQHEPWYTKGDPAKRPFSTREGTTITLRPSGAKFDVPQDWVAWDKQFGNNFHLSRKELDAVARGYGEWDTEYASVVNAVLPFDRCCAHVGDEGWGRDAVAFSDLQLRIYELTEKPEALEKRIESDGIADVQRFSGKAPTIKHDLAATWRRTVLSFDRFYEDYGATANVDFRVRRFEGRTFVFVFMYTDYRSQAESIASVLESFSSVSTDRQ